MARKYILELEGEIAELFKVICDSYAGACPKAVLEDIIKRHGLQLQRERVESKIYFEQSPDGSTADWTYFAELPTYVEENDDE